MVGAGPIGFGVIFLFLSVLSLIIIPVWIYKGRGSYRFRKIVGSTSLFILISCWVIVLMIETHSEIKFIALLAGIFVCLFSVFLPSLHKKILHNRENT